jgi:Protein of unknown function (DUF4242)
MAPTARRKLHKPAWKLLVSGAVLVASANKRSGEPMPLYLDVHNVEGGVSARDVAEAHTRDVEEQAKHRVTYKRYWVDEAAGKIFCLVEAPNAEAAHAVHREAHGLVADEIYEVQEGS